MNNLNVLVTGQTGSGKTSLAKYLLARTPRAFVFDPRDDYDSAPAFYDFKRAAAFYIENHSRNFHMIYRAAPDTFRAWYDILFQTQRKYVDPPLGIFLEESSLYSTSHEIEPLLERLYTQGRRQRISIVTVVQRDTQVNPIIRANSHVWLSMRQRKFSSDFRQTFTPDELERIQSLERFTPLSGDPIEGKHYIPDEPEFPLIPRWTALLRGEPEPAIIPKQENPPIGA